MARSVKKYFTRENIWMTNKHMKSFSTLRVTQEMQIRVTSHLPERIQ